MDQLVHTFEPKNGAFQAPLGVSIKRPFLSMGNASERFRGFGRGTQKSELTDTLDNEQNIHWFENRFLYVKSFFC